MIQKPLTLRIKNINILQRAAVFCAIFLFFCGLSPAADKTFKQPKTKILLLVSERNVDGTLTCWWMNETAFSISEVNLAKTFKDADYQVIEPQTVYSLLKRDKSLKVVNLSDREALRLGRALRADYLVRGSAVAVSGSNIYAAGQRPCFAETRIKLVRIKDGGLVTELETVASNVNIDVAKGGSDVLSSAAVDLAAKIILYINKEGGK
ncbi:MAG: hypothetical protein NC914_03950 [Candidatus Omnitrophica bacterium]|nr:hypothetical protein [Candidatus Omnitrophota bacterium]